MGKKRRNTGNTGLTPPTKTTNAISMADSSQPQPMSQVLQQAHASYISPPASFNVPTTPQQQQNMTFHVPQAGVQYIPQNLQPPIGHSTPHSQPTVQNHFGQQPMFQQPPPQSASVPASSDIHVSLQMLFSHIDKMYNRFDNIDSFMTEKLKKLDLIDKINEKFDRFEKELKEVRMEINEIKKEQNIHKEILDIEERHHNEIADRMTVLENKTYDLETENFELKENLLKQQSHSMKYNLIFGGISDKEFETENTEAVLKHFLMTELDIKNVADIEFQNVHRLRARKDGKPRNIIGRFTNYKDHEKVRKAASKLKDKPEYTISQQFPEEIVERRRRLYPKMKELQRKGQRATLVYDRLFVNGHPYYPQPHTEPLPIHNRDQGREYRTTHQTRKPVL